MKTFDEAFYQLAVVFSQMAESENVGVRCLAAEMLVHCAPKLFAKRLLEQLILDSNPSVAGVAQSSLDFWTWELEPDKSSREKFIEHLERASLIVAAGPEWKKRTFESASYRYELIEEEEK